MLLNQSELLERVKNECSQDTNEIILCSAFLKKEILEELMPYLNRCQSISVYVRWKDIDLAMGVSDLEIYDICKTNGWALLRNQNLHAKFFLIDNRHLFIGSSNYTLSGTGRGNMNIEWNNYIIVDNTQSIELKNSLALSTHVNDEVYHEMLERIEEIKALRDQIKELDIQEPKPSYGFSFDQLPPFSPKDFYNPPLKVTAQSYLQNLGVTSVNDLANFQQFILNNSITNLIRNYHNTIGSIARWGSIRDAIKSNDYLFGLCDNNHHQLEVELYSENRLYHLFCWLENFDDSLILHVNPEYLDDPRRGTCSINLVR